MATKTEKSKKVIDMLDTHKTTMFVTRNKEGNLVSRPMTTQKPEFDGTVWFFVSSDADVIDEVKANSDVNIAYSLEGNYLSLSGTASMVDDDKKKKELWYPELKHWFDGAGPESPKVKLIKVDISTARYWDMAQEKDQKKSKSGDSKTKKEDESPIDSAIVKY
ncbi:MAG: pyridoxamine 5'-phosphate oxidase family protein [Aggregatilineales bacterium]